MEVGNVKFYNEQKGFGFITRPKGEDMFFHASGILGGLVPTNDMPVTFDIADGKRGLQAVNVDMQTATS